MKKLVSLLCALAITPIMALAADKFPDISHDELKAAIAEKKVVLIDVNGSDSYKAGHIPGAVDFETTKDLAAKLPAANEQCSAYQQGAKAAKALGYTNVKHYPKGIAGWKKAGEATEKGS
jgi:rhodanese-related sulfurtransferase